MSFARTLILSGMALSMFVLPSAAPAQSFPPVGNLDCNGYSQIQKPLRPRDSCTDFLSEYRGRGYDNGHYIGHDEPSIGFISTAHNSGNNMQWELTLPVERPLPATQTFENYPTFWFGMALCDPGSFPNGPCIPDSDRNTPFLAGSAFLEMQFYPPGYPPFITQISCDAQHWCASLHINSLEIMSNGHLNPNCTEPTNFAFIQTNGVPTGPAGPASATIATFTPNAQTLLMNQGDRIRVTISDSRDGLLTRIDDLTAGTNGFMVASAANGFQSLNPNTCAPTSFSFRPEFDTAKFGNFVPWADLQVNINFDVEIGHFEISDSDSDDVGCFPGPLIAGCLGADVDFDGTSYLPDWPDGTLNNATSLALHSVAGHGIGPLSADDKGKYRRPFPIIQLETDVSASESTCQPNGVGCVVPPVGAQFYPFYALTTDRHNDGDDDSNCSLLFGNFSGNGIRNFGGAAQYGPANLPWFFGQNSGGPQANPCTPKLEEDRF